MLWLIVAFVLMAALPDILRRRRHYAKRKGPIPIPPRRKPAPARTPAPAESAEEADREASMTETAAPAQAPSVPAAMPARPAAVSPVSVPQRVRPAAWSQLTPQARELYAGFVWSEIWQEPLAHRQRSIKNREDLSQMIQEKEVGIKGIPGLVITSGEKAKGVVLFYHGWSSQKEFQAVRGRILASYGYDVVIPDAVNHGCRGTLDYESKIVYPDFWQTIFQNMTEVPLMLEYIQENWPDTPIAVMGHSMGGFTALGAMSLFKEFKTAVVMNGSGWWDESERRFRASLHIEKPRAYRFIQMQFAAMDPYTHMDRLSGRSLLSLRGGADDVVDGAAQELYLEKLAQRDDVKTQSIVYDDLGHFVTTNMMGDAVNWLQAELH